MRKSIGIVLLLLCCMQLPAQEMTEVEIMQVMTDAFTQNKAGNYQTALGGFLEVGKNTKKQRTEEERHAYVLSQTMAVFCYKQLKQYDEGFRLSETLLQGILSDKEREDIQHLYVVNGYFKATSYLKKTSRRYADAREVLTKILPYADGDMRSRILQKIPLSWYFEGTQHQIGQQYDEALSCIEESRKGFHEIGDSKNELDALCQIGSIKNFTYDALGAQEAYQQAESLARSSRNEVMLISILRELRKISKQIGNTELSTRLDNEMDSLIAQAGEGKVKFEYYNYKGDEAKEQGQYLLAESWYKRNEPYIQQLSKEHVGAERNIYYLKLRELYKQEKEWDKALQYAILYKGAYHFFYDKTDRNYYWPFMDIANIYRLKGDSVQCFNNLDTLFTFIDKIDEPRELKQIYLTRAQCFFAFNKYQQALEDLKKADSLMATKYDEYDGDRIWLLPFMGGVEHRLCHYEESERIYRKFVENIKILSGMDHQDYIDALNYCANAEAFAGHLEQACSDYISAVDRLKEQIQQKLPYLNTAEREGYWKQVSKLIQDMTPFALEAKEFQTPFTAACYDGLILSKSFLLGSERSTYDLIRKLGTDEDAREFLQIASMHAKLRGWENEGARRTDSIMTLTSKVRQMESRLAERCRSYGDMTAFMSIGYKKIKEKLKDEDVLIDFTDFVSESRGRVYAAYLVDNKHENPLLVKLFAESKIDSLQVNYPEHYYKKPYAETMLELIWDPFKDKVTEGATVYYVPSQLLFQIALESLPMEDGSLLGEHYHFVRLSSARELVNLDLKLNIDMVAHNPNAVLYGGLLYDLEANDWEAEARKYDVSSLLAVRGDVLRGDSIFRLLPGSKKEVDAIGKLLKSHRLNVELFTGKRGTEESFLSMSGKAPEILHVATHGFYYTPDEAQEIDFLRGYKDAMLLSGLVMSGGNAAWLGKELPDGVLGGILTASNIARLDLSNTELTVLSACESGKGKATAEGLYGLQRAFKKAGVKTMIMSLWNVSDVVGTEFMNLFYEKLLDKDNHFDKRKAFEEAKKSIRKKYPDPYYWACFVMLD